MPTSSRLAVRFLILVASAGIAGCGAEAYQSRIEGNSIPFFGYQKELDSSLGTRWRTQDGKVSIRMPLGFKEVPGPKKKAGSPAPTGRDPRLPPDFIVDEIPGLLAGFKGTMRAETGGKVKPVPVYAFVTSNRALLASKDPEAKPAAYDAALLTAIGAGLRKGAVSVTALKPFAPTESLSPAQKEFAAAPRLDQASFDATIDDVPMKYEVYVRRQPPQQVAVLFVVPKEAARDEQLRKRIDLSLQTLRIESGSGATPASPAGGTSAGSGPAL